MHITVSVAEIPQTSTLALARSMKVAQKTIRLQEIKGWGRGMDPATYRVHAYEKGVMLLAMIEQASVEKALMKTVVANPAIRGE